MERYVPILAVLFAFLGWYSAPGYGKAQYVRLLDVLLYGPFLVYISLKRTYTFSDAEKVFLLFLGVTTITYNLRNYIEIEKEKKKDM